VGPLPEIGDFEAFCQCRAQFLKDWTRLSGLPDSKKMAREQVQELTATLTSKEVIFWMWPRLSDQMTLLQMLDWYADNDYQGEIKLINAGEYPNRYDKEYVKQLYQSLNPVSEEQIKLAQITWSAIRQASPERLLGLVKKSANSPSLPL